MTRSRCAGQLLLALAILVLLGSPSVARAAEPKLGTFIKIDAVGHVGWGENRDIVARLYLASGQLLPDERLTLTIGVDSKQRRTDATGKATFPIRKNYEPGKYPVRVSFSETSRYLASAASAALVIDAPSVEVQTVPPIPGIAFELDGNKAMTDEAGIATVTFDPDLGTNRHPSTADSVDLSDGLRAHFSRWYVPTPSRPFTATYDLYYLIQLNFVDLAGQAVDPKRIGEITLKSSTGEQITLAKPGDIWVQGSRVVPFSGGLQSKDIYYSIQSVEVGGSNVVNRSQQKFVPSEGRDWEVSLLFYSAEIHATDALFGFPMGSGIRLEYPDKHVEQLEFGKNASLTLTSMPRGDYGVTVVGPGLSFRQPLALSRDQDVSLNFLSYLDLIVGLLVVVGFAVILVAIGRPRLLTALGGWRSPAGAAERILICLIVGAVIACGILVAPRVLHPNTARTGAAGQPSVERSPAALPTTDATSRAYVVREGDTLGEIAARFYGRNDAWQQIYRANSEKIQDPDELTVGIRLIIP